MCISALEHCHCSKWVTNYAVPGTEVLSKVTNPGSCNETIVEMLEVLVSNAAYTGKEEQRTGSAVSKSLQHSSAQFQVHSRNLHRTESHKEAYETVAQEFPAVLAEGFTSHNPFLPTFTYYPANNKMAPWHC